MEMIIHSGRKRTIYDNNFDATNYFSMHFSSTINKCQNVRFITKNMYQPNPSTTSWVWETVAFYLLYIVQLEGNSNLVKLSL